MKYCWACQKTKPRADFHNCKRSKDGKDGRCKECSKARSKEYRKTATAKEYQRKWRQNNPDKVKAYKEKYLSNPDNKERSLQTRRKYTNQRRQNDIAFSISTRMTNLMNTNLARYTNTNKGGKRWQDLVGYDVKALIKHIEKQFLPGMTWENRGEWHIDHIVPVSVFNITSINDIDFQRCWSLKNLRPLWKQDNIAKTNKLNKPFQPALAI